MKMESKIIRLAWLVEYISDPKRTAAEIASAIRADIDNGIITEEEGLELVLEYTNS